MEKLKTTKGYMKRIGRLAGSLVCILTLGLLTACNDSSGVGTELVTNEISVIVDSSFTVTGHSVRTEAVLSRTVVQMLGSIEAPEFGYMSSEVVTQFMPSNLLDTAGVTVNDVDSLKLIMLVNPGSFVGDSLALMGVEVYPLVKQLGVPMYSDFVPDGFYDANRMLGSTVYNLTKNSEPDSLKSYNFFTLSVDLPLELGRSFFTEFVEHPETYSSPTRFAEFFPGLYLKNSYGSGRLTRVGNTTIAMFYHQHVTTEAGNDSIIPKGASYFAVTPEIITNNDITLSLSDQVKSRVDAGEAILLAPVGLDVNLQFPARDIVEAYRRGSKDGLGVVNRLTMSIPVEKIENKYDIAPPTDVLLILSNEREEFFIQNKLPDNITSFRATLSTLDDGSMAYVFSDMRQYLLDLMAKESISEQDITFDLVPVTVASETNTDYYGNVTTTVTAVTPYVTEPRMAKILLEKVKIKFVYSLQTANF